VANSQFSQQQQITHVFSPHNCQLGGTPRASRRTNCHNTRNTVALLVLPAALVGGSFAIVNRNPWLRQLNWRLRVESSVFF
jgi:hypothetical protein